MKITSKIISVLLAVLLTATLALSAPAADTEDYTPTIIIPGVFQCDVRLYDENGEPMKNSEGEELKGPFFLPATSDIVKTAIKKAGFQLLKVLLTQQDWSGRFSTVVSETAADIFSDKLASDSHGNLNYDIRAVDYNTALSNLSEYDRNFALSAIPLHDYVNIVGADKLYFFSYYSFDSIDRLAARLYELIQTAKRETGSDKVNLVPISQGGTIADYLLEYYPQVTDELDRIIYIVPAVDGTNILGDIFTAGLLDDPDALYGYMWKQITDDEATGSLINLALRLFPNKVLNDVLDKTADALMNRLKYSTALWALIPSSYYEEAADKYLSGEEDAYTRSITDKFHTAQLNYKQNILRAREAGVEIFDICNYNVPLYALGDTWDDVQADGVIQLDSTSMGAYSGAVDQELPEGYVQQGNEFGTCGYLDSYSYIDPHNLIDASTGLLPDQTFYFYNGNHETTAQNDVVIKLATRLMVDRSFTSVHSYPDVFPQFNEARRGRNTINALNRWKNYDTSNLSEEDAAELAAAIAEVEAQANNTVVDNEKWEAAKARFNAITDKIEGREPEKESAIKKWFNKFVIKLDANVAKTVGYQGFSDVLRIKK